MSNLKIYNFIAQLLSPSSDHKNLIKYFGGGDEFWNKLIKVSSSQLILPLVCNSLKIKKIFHLAPDELQKYLNEISSINYNRNRLILAQVSKICQIFKINKINYVLLKGSAMLIRNKYDVKKERMIGDIDILVEKSELQRSKKILIKYGYEEQNKIKNTFFNFIAHLKFFKM